MKKIILLALLAIVSVSTFARKSYITVYGEPNNKCIIVKLSGDVPSDIDYINYRTDFGYWETEKYHYTLGDILNILSELGYEVESMNTIVDGNYPYVNYLLSKETSSSQTTYTGDVNKDGKINVSDISTLVNIILGIVRDNPSLLELSR